MFRSKRQRGESSQSEEPSPLELAERRLTMHRQRVGQWQAVLEREICMPLNPAYRKFTAAIRELGWRTFTEEPTTPIIPLVKEFYANLHTTLTDRVTIFDTEVRFDVDTINEVLGITRIPELDLFKRLKMEVSDIDMHEIQHTLSLGKGLHVCHPPHTISIGSLPEET